MQEEHHDLHPEFREFKARIIYLKNQNAQFAKLYAEYGELVRIIEKLENSGPRLHYREMELLKSQRVELKDLLYSYLMVPM